MKLWNTMGIATCLGLIAGRDGAIDPPGFLHIESFRLEGTTPVWTFAFADALLEKRIWMEHGANTTYVQYTLVRASRPLRLAAKVLVNWRGLPLFDACRRTCNWTCNPADGGLRIQAGSEAPPFYLRSAEAAIEPRTSGIGIMSWRRRGRADSTIRKTICTPALFTLS